MAEGSVMSEPFSAANREKIREFAGFGRPGAGASPTSRPTSGQFGSSDIVWNRELTCAKQRLNRSIRRSAGDRGIEHRSPLDDRHRDLLPLAGKSVQSKCRTPVQTSSIRAFSGYKKPTSQLKDTQDVGRTVCPCAALGRAQ